MNKYYETKPPCDGCGSPALCEENGCARYYHLSDLPKECDWGRCNEKAVDWRHDEKAGYLPVCEKHRAPTSVQKEDSET